MSEFDFSGAGKRMQKIRKSNNMTQVELAELLNVSSNHISHIENYGAKFSLDLLAKFCKVFKCSMDYISFGKKQNEALSILPDEIINILFSKNKTAQKHLVNYLNMFLNLYYREDVSNQMHRRLTTTQQMEAKQNQNA